MAKNVQQQGGDAESEKTVVGLPRQLRIDTSNQEIRLHDGSKVGGHRFPNRDSNDLRYQLRSPELDGLDFDSLGIGFLVRLAPADYRLRVLEFDSNAFDVINSDGISGNPSISLKSVIAGARTFSGPVNFTSGLTGAHTGTSTGTHTGLQVGDVTGDVTGDLLGNSFGTHTGALDVTGAAVAFDPSQIPLAAINQTELLTFLTQQAFKPGMIMQWFGIAANVPAGWIICDGSNGTPNMLNRFPYGAANDAAVGTSGGSGTHVHPVTVDPGGSHTHVTTVEGHSLTIAEMPQHSHGNGIVDDNVGNLFCYGTKVSPAGGNINSDPGTYTTQGNTEPIGGGNEHTHPSSADPAGVHIHTAEATAASSLPPYRALYFIMKGN